MPPGAVPGRRRAAALLVVSLLASVLVGLSAVRPTPVRAAGPAGVLDATAQRPAEAVLDRLGAIARRDGHVRVIVGLRTRFVPEGALTSAAATDQRHRLRESGRALASSLSAAGGRAVRTFQTIPFVAAELPPGGIAALGASDVVASVTEDEPLPAAAVPVETSRIVQAPQLHDLGVAGAGWSVAVLDTGVASSHPFLGGRVVAEACFSQDSCPGGGPEATGPGAAAPCGYAPTACGHGTHVAGIAAGSAANGSGVARGAGVVAVQVFSRVSSQTSCGGDAVCALSYTSDQIAGLEYAYAKRDAHRIAAVNLSLGAGRHTGSCDGRNPAYTAAVANLASVGIPTVVAAGNAGWSDAVSFPACISGAVTVTSTSAGDRLSAFSNTSPSVDLAAPGEAVLSSVPGGGMQAFQGTSMAAPHVAGAWALLRQREPTAAVDELLGRLQTAGAPVTDREPAAPAPLARRIRILVAAGIPAANDHFAGALPVGALSYRNSQSTTLASVEAGEPRTCGTAAMNRTVWYRYRPPTTRDVTADTRGSFTADTVLAVYRGAALDDLLLVACDDDAAGNLKSAVSFQAVAGRTYYLQVGTHTQTPGLVGHVHLNLSAGADEPLAVRTAGTGAGTVTSGDGRIACGTSCTAAYRPGAVVTLSAAAAANSTFQGWTGAPACGSTGACTVTMDRARTVTATFGPRYRRLDVALSGPGAGTVTSAPDGVDCGTTCSASMRYGRTVTLTATAGAGSVFTGWDGACTGTGPCRLDMTSPTTVTARFAIASHRVTVQRTGPGTGTVASTAGGVACGAACDAAYTEGTTVTFTASAAAGSTFDGWDAPGCSGTAPCTLAVRAALTVRAAFGLAPPAPPSVSPAPSETPSSPAPSETPVPSPDPPATPVPDAPLTGAGRGFPADPQVSGRIDRADPAAAAVAISRVRFDDAASAGRYAAHVVLSRDDTFPDSLAGAPLTGDGPLLLTPTDSLAPGTAAEIARVLPAAGTVYLLGGPAAIAPAVEDQLRSAGYTVIRLAGPSRVETALRVADAVRGRHPAGREVAVARAYGAPGNPSSGWADSVTGGGFGARAGMPIVLTPSGALHPAVAEWLRQADPDRTLLLGGTVALSTTIEASLPGSVRVSGPERTATAAAIATDLWQTPTTGPRSFVVVNGGHDSGWAFGLAAAGLSADSAAPIVLVIDAGVPPATAALVGSCGPAEVNLLVVGDPSVVAESTRARLDELDGAACGAG